VKNYELLTIVKPTLTDEETAARVEFIKELLVKNGAEIIKQDDMGMRKLAYTVQKNDRGYYTVFYFQAPGIAISEIERVLRITEDVIKFFTVKYETKKERTFFDSLVKEKAAPVAPKAPEAVVETEVKVEAAPEAPATPAAPEAPAAPAAAE